MSPPFHREAETLLAPEAAQSSSEYQKTEEGHCPPREQLLEAYGALFLRVRSPEHALMERSCEGC